MTLRVEEKKAPSKRAKAVDFTYHCISPNSVTSRLEKWTESSFSGSQYSTASFVISTKKDRSTPSPPSTETQEPPHSTSPTSCAKMSLSFLLNKSDT